MSADDAWKQMDDLVNEFSRSWDVRPDLRVTALACDRGVQLSLAHPEYGFEGMKHGLAGNEHSGDPVYRRAAGWTPHEGEETWTRTCSGAKGMTVAAKWNARIC